MVKSVTKEDYMRGLLFKPTKIKALVFSATKFFEGAWIVLVLIPAGVVLLSAIHRHYESLSGSLSLDQFGEPPPPLRTHQCRVRHAALLTPLLTPWLAAQHRRPAPPTISAGCSSPPRAARSPSGRRLTWGR